MLRKSKFDNNGNMPTWHNMMMTATLVDGRNVVIRPSPTSDEEMLWRFTNGFDNEENAGIAFIYQWNKAKIMGKAKVFKNTTSCYIEIEANNIVLNLLED
ncbi:TPA: hypothetical protein QCW42_004119 [Bacillus cereus]|nr:hypothetical protein [Bacillus cereus]